MRSMSQRDICVHDLPNAYAKVVKIRQKCKKIRQNRISMPYFFNFILIWFFFAHIYA